MKLGTETGSVMNHLRSNDPTPPVVGKGATELMWTDRKAYFVNAVSKDGKTCTIEKARAIRTDKRGMAEAQDYRYERTGHEVELRYLWGAWRYKIDEPWANKKWHKMNIVFGYMDEYFDFSF